MRSLSDLQEVATQNGVVSAGLGREELMDALRAKLGTPDPSLQIDPMKAKDLKNEVKWGGEDAFAGIAKYLNPETHVLEPKLDGARVRLFLGTTANSLNSGRRSDVTYAYIERADNFPHLRDAVVPELAGTIIDAEIMVPGPVEIAPGQWTVGSLNSVMAVLNIAPAKAVARQAKHGQAVLYCFDVLAVNGDSAMSYPLSERRKMLKQVLGMLDPEGKHMVAIPQFDATAGNLQAFLDAGYEGGMIKRRASTYQAGKRSADWLKVKRMSTGDFFIIGSTDGKGRNEGKVGSLMLAYADGAGNPVYCADVRGFDDRMCDELTDPATGKVKQQYIGRVVEVMAQCRTKNDRLRHPHFVRWRDDKSAADCQRDQIELFVEA